MKRDLSRLDCSIRDLYGLVYMLVLDHLVRIDVSQGRMFRKDECFARTNVPQGRIFRKAKALATSSVRVDGCVASFSVFIWWLSTLLSGFPVVVLRPVNCPFLFFSNNRMF